MFQKRIASFFNVNEHGSTIKKEILAGIVSFFTIVYIIAVNSSILAETGMPIEGATWATILISFIGCIIMGVWAKSPMILVPGMGVNAMFAYTFVQSMGLSWQEALAVVFVSGALFVIIAFTRFSRILESAVPDSLKHAISVGLGLFLSLIGLEKSGIIIKGDHSLISLGNLGSSEVIVSLITLIIGIILFLRKVPANFFITIFTGTFIAWLFGLTERTTGGFDLSLSGYGVVFGAMSFDRFTSLPFWIATFSLTMVLVFEHIGLVSGQVTLLKQPEKYTPAFRASAITTMLSGIFGSSPTVSTVESASGITAGGRTGHTAITTGMLFLLSILFIPYVKLIPSSAIAPVLIIVGGLMLQNIKHINLQDLTEGLPAFFIIIMIPFSYSIADGIAFGFIAYPLAKLVVGKAKQVSLPLYIIAGLFLLNFVLHSV
ncbi:NCS2 family permease [Fredinandcohnia humi]